MEKRPPGQSDFSLTRTWPWPSLTMRVAHGSGTQAPAMLPASKEARVVALSSGRMVTSPLPPFGPGVGEALLGEPGAQGDVLGVPELGGGDGLSLELVG